VIVVVGQPVLRSTSEGPVASGPAARIALSAASRGAAVQLIGKIGEDPAGDELLLALTRGSVGHVALLRDPTRETPRLMDRALDPAGGADEDDGSLPVEPVDPTRRPGLDVGDIELGLRYLTEFRVIVSTEPLDGAVARVVSDAAGWAGATVVALVPEGGREPDGLPDGAIVLASPPDDPDGTFARFVGEVAAAIDAGSEPATAFRDAVAADGWEPAERTEAEAD